MAGNATEALLAGKSELRPFENMYVANPALLSDYTPRKYEFISL
jgi:hypothetical protein